MSVAFWERAGFRSPERFNPAPYGTTSTDSHWFSEYDLKAILLPEKAKCKTVYSAPRHRSTLPFLAKDPSSSSIGKEQRLNGGWRKYHSGHGMRSSADHFLLPLFRYGDSFSTAGLATIRLLEPQQSTTKSAEGRTNVLA